MLKSFAARDSMAVRFASCWAPRLKGEPAPDFFGVAGSDMGLGMGSRAGFNAERHSRRSNI